MTKKGNKNLNSEEKKDKDVEKKDESKKQEGVKIEGGRIGINIKGPIDVFDKHGNYIRTFCEETHGPKYRELVAEFIGYNRPKINRNVSDNPVPEENRGRFFRPHDFSIKQADVVDAKGYIRKTFTRERDGIHFIEKAYASFNKEWGLPDTGSPNRLEHKPDRMIKCRVELRPHGFRL